jgi:hypothetical protein
MNTQYRRSFYVASKTKHAEMWRDLRARGYRVTSTWIDEAGEGESASYEDLAVRCVKDVAVADFVLLYCQPGEVLKGALIEAGIALALGKRVRCVGYCDSLSRVFNQHALWSMHASITEVLMAEQIINRAA